jgi:uncharacterized LabA/DUF88 family protein
MDRCAVLVDAGYLLGAAATLVAGAPDRRALTIDYAQLVEALIDEASAQTGLPVLRMLWYDGAINGQPRPEHRALRVLPDVKVRLGELVKREGRLQQKGVDSYLQRDLNTLARNKSVADVVLVGGDEDLRRSLEEAQDYGVRVHLWGVEAAATEYNQSPSLIAEADRRWVIDRTWIVRFIQVEPSDETSGSPPSPVPEPARSGAGLPREADRSEPLATDEDLQRLVASFGREAPAGDPVGRGWSVQSPSHELIPRLQELTSDPEAWKDNEEDATAPGRTPGEIGAAFGRRWVSRSSHANLGALLDVEPRAPNYLDGELLRYAERQGVDTWENEPARHEVRAGFWRGVHEAAPGAG